MSALTGAHLTASPAVTSWLGKATTDAVHRVGHLSHEQWPNAIGQLPSAAERASGDALCRGLGAGLWRPATAARARLWKAHAVLWVLGLAGAVWAAGQAVPVKRIRDFRMPEFYETAAAGESPRLKTLLSGSEAQPLDARGRLIAVTGMRVEQYLPDGRTNFVARAPACLLDALDRTVCSTGWLEVSLAQGQLFIEGQGFFLEVTNLHLIISNRVRTVIRPELMQRVQP